MGDPRRFWKESIGVTGPVRPKASPARPAEGTPAPGARPAPRPAGPGTAGTPGTPGTPGLDANRAARTGVVGGDEPTGPLVTGAVTGPVGFAGPGRRATPGASLASAAAVEQVLFGLPTGSIVFADEVARRLWAQPAPADLKALAAILEHQNGIPPGGPLRELAVRAVALRQRVQRLLEHAARGTLDHAQRAAHAAEWARLTRMVRETSVEIDVRIAEHDRAALKAAAALLPDPEDIEAEALLAAEAAALVDPSAAPGGDVMDVPEARDVLQTMREGRPRQHDPLFLDVLAAWSFARRAVGTLDIAQMERGRRLVARVTARMDAVVTQLATEHRRDPEGNARLAGWRRYLMDARSRIDETLTRPAPGPSKLRPRVGEGAPNPGDDKIVEHLREVRRKAGGRAADAGGRTGDAGEPGEASGTKGGGLFSWFRKKVTR